MADKSPHAFPCAEIEESGMTLRDYFANDAPVTMKDAWEVWADGENYAFDMCMGVPNERRNFLNWFANIRFEYADAMLKAREKSND